MTIVEFLTARLDEAEARLQKVFSQMDRPHWPGCDYPGDMPGSCDCDLTEWLHADIAAKRAIVDFMRSEDAAGSGLTDTEGIARSLRAIAVLRHLASPYAGHPDYQQEWAPK